MSFSSPLKEFIQRCTRKERPPIPPKPDYRPGLYTLLFIAAWVLAADTDFVHQLVNEDSRSVVKISLGIATFILFYLFWQFIFRWVPTAILLVLTMVAWVLVFWQWWQQVHL